MRHLSRWYFGKVPVGVLGIVFFHSPYPLGREIGLRLLYRGPVHSEDWSGSHPYPCQPRPLGACGRGMEIYRPSCNPRGEFGVCCSTSARNRNYFTVKQPLRTVDDTNALRVMRSLYNRSTHSSEIKMRLLRALTATRSQISLKLCKEYKVYV